MRKLILHSESTQPLRNNFDAIRLAMALLVVWSHSFAIHLNTEKPEWISLLLGGTFNAGNVGVMAFFIISGFLIAQSWVRSKSLRSYLEKRVRRIYPGYMVASTVSALVMVYFFVGHPTVLDWLKTFGMNLLLQGYSPITDEYGTHTLGPINGVLWSIPFEFWCYLGVAALGLLWLVKKRWFILAALVSIMLLHVLLDATGRKPGLGIIGLIIGWPYLWTKMAPCFLLGMAAYNFRSELPRSRYLLVGLFTATVVACRINEDIGFVVGLPSLAYSVFYVAFSESIPLHNAARFGDFSYGVYLYGFLIQKVVQFTVAKEWNLAEFFIATATLSILAGVASWYLIESPFMPRKIGRRAQTSSRFEALEAKRDVTAAT